MKTTIDIPDNDLKEAMDFLQTSVKRDAVVTALRDFNRRHHMARLVRFSGTCEFTGNAELEQMETGESDR